MAVRQIQHVSIKTGERWHSQRGEVNAHALRRARLLLDEGLSKGRIDLAGVEPSGHWLQLRRLGTCCLAATVMRGNSDALITFGVSVRSRCGPALWRLLVSGSGARVSALRTPVAPWCAVRTEAEWQGDAQPLEWLAELELAIAWAWVDRVSITREPRQVA